MKRILSIAILMAVCAISAQAQFEIDSYGRVKVTPYNQYIGGAFQVGDGYHREGGVVFNNVGRISNLSVYRTNNDSTSIGIDIYSSNIKHSNEGVKVEVAGAGGYHPHGIGVNAYAYSAKMSAGVYGRTSYSQSDSVNHFAATAICGTAYGQYSPTFMYSGRFAGFFNGNVRVSAGMLIGSLYTPYYYNGANGNTPSGSTLLAENENRTLDKLLQVQAIQFMRDKRELEVEEECPIVSEDEKKSDMNNEKRTITCRTDLPAVQYGLVAEQLKKVYPELVYEDIEGNVSINYIEMIPLLVQSISELSSELAELKGTSKKKVKAQTTAIEETVEDIDQVRMDQNKPNPFSGSTVITLNVPETVKQANIFIYDLSGKQIQSVPVTERGETNITVYASGLSAGMYIYTLVVDGQVKVTRRMIVSEK